jgi:acetyl-CoA carboxylase biotin carboxyl carrier protein
LKLRVRKGPGNAPQVTHQLPAASALPLTELPVVHRQAVLPPAAIAAPGPLAADDTELELAVVKSPIVGTFYRSSEPGAASFVDVGDRVKKDQVLCIIEAMKLMNEITSEYEGEIVSVYVENGKPVQYGERLFAIKTA